jgi:hypothetical protein
MEPCSSSQSTWDFSFYKIQNTNSLPPQIKIPTKAKVEPSRNLKPFMQLVFTLSFGKFCDPC